ncbi:MAG TPA: hypothetical protein VFX97_16865 [Pyrinomonadaceae bacterium]|nr:hypothetical protein [Pyrinomonadaceae bacterium]
MNELDRSLKAKMTADGGAGGLATLSNGGFHQQAADENTPFNYTIFERLTDLPSYTFGNVTAFNYTPYQIRHYSVKGANNSTLSPQEVTGKMLDRTIVLLTNPSLNVTGKSVLCCRFDREIPLRPEWDETLKRWIYGKGAIYALWLTNA